MSDTLRVLLIDDNPDDRALAARELQREFPGIQITQVFDEAGLDTAIAGGDFDLVITGYQLLWSNGLAVLRTIRERYPDRPVIMFTNTATQEEAIEALKSGLDDYVIKSAAHFVRLPAAVRSALERAKARRHVRRLEDNARFLSEASAVLAASLDYETTLTSVATLAVPYLADWAAVDVLDGDDLAELAVVASDPTHERAIRALRRRYPQASGAPNGLSAVLRSGHPILYPVDDEMLRAEAADDSERLELLRALGMRSVMLVPMVARGRGIGVLTLVHTWSDRLYDDTDLQLAQNLAHRAALAVDNSRLYRESQEAVRARDQFLGLAAHELRTPLTTVSASIQLAEHRLMGLAPRGSAAKTADPADLARRVDVMAGLLDRARRQALRLNRFVDDLLAISRTRTGQLALALAPHDLTTLVREAVAELAVAWPDRQFVTVLPDQPLMVQVDADRIIQVVGNFLTNALKYAPQHLPITITVSREGGQARVAVRDEGPGLPPRQLARVWMPFYRVEGVSHQNGSSLGLYLSREIVEQHRGAVGVDSIPGQGATFWFTLSLTPGT